jgi:hypothetical protein
MSYPHAVGAILDRYSYLDADSVSTRLRYSTFVSLAKRYMYFEVPKAACTEMKLLLRRLEGAPPIKLTGGPETRRDLFVHVRENVPLPSLLDLDNATQREVLESDDFCRLTFVRNPYSRLVSTWKSKILVCAPGHDLYQAIKGQPPAFHNKSLVTFKEFVEYISTKCDLRVCNPHWRRQADHLLLGALNFSCIGRVENMAEGLERFRQHLGLREPLPAGRTNITPPTAFPTYTPELAAKVFMLYREDFEKFGYDRNGWQERARADVQTPPSGMVPEERFYDEIIERNLIIAQLFRECERLRARPRWISWTVRLVSAGKRQPHPASARPAAPRQP